MENRHVVDLNLLKNEDPKKYMAKTRVGPYTSLVLPNRRVNIDFVAKKIKEMAYLRTIETLYQVLEETYENDKSEGTVLKSLLAKAREFDDDIANYLENIISEDEPELIHKNDIFQVMIFTGLVKRRLAAITKENINNEELVNKIANIFETLKYDYKPEVWVEVFTSQVLHMLKEIKSYLK